MNTQASINHITIREKIATLEPLLHEFFLGKSLSEKVKVLNAIPQINQELQKFPDIVKFLETADEKIHVVVKSIFLIGQGPVVFREVQNKNREALNQMIQIFWETEQFYDVMGGIIGYHLTVLKLIQQKNQHAQAKEHYQKPYGYDLQKSDHFIRWGIESLPQVAVFYPVGGAGDRLNLLDENTGEPLPAAQLPFCGRTLLEGLIRDLEAKEFLYYKITGKQTITPIVMMTSHEKHNHRRIVDICEKNEWFGRKKENFFFMLQPLVPVITIEGQWAMRDILSPVLKPGGHGVVWKLALDSGAFEWLEKKGCTKALVRQINNPVAGTDQGLLALAGIGCHENKKFGFSSCPRAVNTAEGMDVLVSKEVGHQFAYRLSNIEYTDFKEKGIEDAPEHEGSPYSKYPANTNILFIDLKTIKELASHFPVPGKLINFKNKAPAIDSNGDCREVHAGRLESTMQNISDEIQDFFPKPLQGEEFSQMSTFLTYNDRRKTISVTKNTYDRSKPFHGTPEGCFYEILENHHDLLAEKCHMVIPHLCSETEYLKNGPNFLTFWHPALGPLYAIMAQKIRGGEVSQGSELQLEAAEVFLENLHLSGSLLVMADSPLGKRDSSGVLQYSQECGKCFLRNVRVENQGIDRSAKNVYWKNVIHRKEAFEVVLRGNAEFFAEDITVVGGLRIEVPDGYRYRLELERGEIHVRKEKITTPTWSWKYTFGESTIVKLERQNSES